MEEIGGLDIIYIINMCEIILKLYKGNKPRKQAHKMALGSIHKNVDVFPVWTWVPSPRHLIISKCSVT